MPDLSLGLASDGPSNYSESVTLPYEQLQELTAAAAAVTIAEKGLSVRPGLGQLEGALLSPGDTFMMVRWVMYPFEKVVLS